ncbi:unnamed protein product [Ranitomeya imitator]|uniref:Uncharacterized protein n=1 Tax=Ranitomeya imitator TaxID=111125 RepID=A0ABN9MQ74_9NEOB|nr:unnamed protein product [Ranitomeya imitator]
MREECRETDAGDVTGTGIVFFVTLRIPRLRTEQPMGINEAEFTEKAWWRCLLPWCPGPGGLPTLSVTTLPSDRILPDGGVMEEYSGGAPATLTMHASTASCSMEKIFFPGINSFKEIIAPPRGSGSSLSFRKLQKDTRSRDVTMVWVPNPQNNPLKTQDREKPLKVWIKDLSLSDQLGGMKREKGNPAPTINKKKKKPPIGGCPLKLTLVGSSPLPHTKNLMAAQDAQEQTEEAVKCRRRPHQHWPDMDSPPSPSLTGMIVENRRVVLHDAREKCPVITHTGPVYRMDQQQSAALNNMSNLEVDLDSIRNQYYLWKKYIHIGGPNRRIKPPDHRTSKTRRSYKSVAPDHLDHIGLFPYDHRSALSYYKSQALFNACNQGKHRVTKRGPALSYPMFTLVTQGPRHRWSLESCLCDSSPATTLRFTYDHGQVVSLVVIVDMNARKRAQKEIPGERREETQSAEPPQAMRMAPERPDQEKKDVPGDDESTRVKTSPDAAESTAESTDVHENPEQRTSSPQPNPPPPTPIVIILYSECQCHYPVSRVSASLSCIPSVSVIILYPECQCHYPVSRVSVSLSCIPSVSVIILYPECQCHYPVPRVSVSLSCTPSVSVIILYPECQCHYPVSRVSVSLSCIPVIILYPECQCHYPVPRVSVSLSCTPSVSVIILYPECQCHYPVPRVRAGPMMRSRSHDRNVMAGPCRIPSLPPEPAACIERLPERREERERRWTRELEHSRLESEVDRGSKELCMPNVGGY